MTQISHRAFTAAMHKQAEREGWWLSQRDDGYLEIQKFDEDTRQRFSSDDAARGFVSTQARDKGSYLHQLALHLDGTRWD